MDAEQLKRYLDAGMSFEAIGRAAGLHASTVGYWARKHGFVSAYRADAAARGGLARELLERLVENGSSIREIAQATERSPSTVRHWLRVHGLVTTAGQRRSEARRAKEAGLGNLIRACPNHGRAEFILEARGHYRCLRCRSEAVTERRRRVKTILVAEAGGRCGLCGYDRHVGALQFHHVDPDTKSFSVAHLGVARSLERCREEARKCVLLCANCHAEIEAGVATLPR
jgi:DNA-binding transcriptional ArsR family regulator